MDNKEAIKNLEFIKDYYSGFDGLTIASLRNLDFNLTRDEIEALDIAIEKLKNETLEGEWIYGEDEQGQDGWFCSKCDFFVPYYYEYYENDSSFISNYKTCGHCGAKMTAYTCENKTVGE